MGMFDHFPYTNFHELNMDWILQALKEIEQTMDQFVSLNIIKYADPIQWNITSQYSKNTIVIDPISGTAYISVENVPSGVSLSNTEYWSVVFDLSRFITMASQNFANSYEPITTTTATISTDKGKWLVWDNILYEALNDIHVGDRYVINGNIRKTTVETFVERIKAAISQEILDRISADNALQVNIDAEVLARQQADQGLQNNIDAEVLARQQADQDLQNNIDAEVLARQQADQDLQNNIDAEVLARQQADQTEELARQEADQRLQNAMNAIIVDTQNLSSYKANYINVKKIGAKGDGNLHPLSEFYGSLDDARVDYPFVNSLSTSIDSAAIQKAVNSGLCFIPSGNYQINTPIVLPQTKAVSVIGEFRREVYLTIVTSNINVFEFTRVNGTSIFDISNITIRSGENVTGVTAIYFHGLIDGATRYEDNWLTCTNCHFYDLKRAFDLYCCSNIYVDHCYAVRVQIFAYLGRAASFTHFSHILTLLGYSTFYCEDEAADGISNGLYIYDVIGVYNTALTFRIRGWQAVYIQNCSADFQGGADGAYFILDCQDVTISGCWCAGTDIINSYGFRIWTSYNVHVSDCTVEHFRTGMRIDAPSYCGVTVRNCVWIANTNVDIQVVAGSGCIITENTFRSGNSTPLKGYSETNYNVATNNVFIGSAYDTTLGANSVVGDNVFI